jgi:ribonucleoside-triphosphate reductase (thioredoxin)
MAEFFTLTKDVDLRNLLSDIKFYEGYSRYSEDLNKYESWSDAVHRVMDMHKKFYKEKMSPALEQLIDFAERAYKEKKVLGAQRALQFGGKQLLKHQMRMYNCTSSHANRVQFFGEYFYILLCGAGAGFSVQKHHVAQIPMIRPRTKQAKTHVIEDSIEGWATSLNVLLSSFFIGGGVNPEYEGRKIYFDSTKVRNKGALISGGFKAPGPEPLIKALNLIERLLVSRA